MAACFIGSREGWRSRSEERRGGKECRYRCDWSSDVCSSDLQLRDAGTGGGEAGQDGSEPVEWPLVLLVPGRGGDRDRKSVGEGKSVDIGVTGVQTCALPIYSFAMLAPAGEKPGKMDLSLWNGRLLYWFQGGVAIGHTQGTVHGGSLNPDILRLGYAIADSSGNNTGSHHHPPLAGETAMMTKERFIERYGVPTYTVGLGGSGGAIQQYIIGQNLPGVLDALLPVQSYSDMVTQTIHVGDCELLEHYTEGNGGADPKRTQTQ